MMNRYGKTRYGTNWLVWHWPGHLMGAVEGLLANLKRYQEQIRKRIEGYNVEFADAGMADNPEKARKAAELLKSNEVGQVFLYISTYALSMFFCTKR